jgi:hypothetical protein
MTHIDAATYARLHSYVFSGMYPGYRPDVTEAPNGDGYWDEGKRFAHIALKYLNKYGFGRGSREMEQLLHTMTDVAVEAAVQIGLPPEYWPTIDDANIRILEYPPSAMSAQHTDFDLFTLPMWRNRPDRFKYVTPTVGDIQTGDAILDEAREHYPGIHFGELMPKIDKTYMATEHKVLPSNRHQYAAVYFAMPPLSAVLPNRQIVRNWLAERKKRSRRTT